MMLILLEVEVEEGGRRGLEVEGMAEEAVDILAVPIRIAALDKGIQMTLTGQSSPNPNRSIAGAAGFDDDGIAAALALSFFKPLGTINPDVTLPLDEDAPPGFIPAPDPDLNPKSMGPPPTSSSSSSSPPATPAPNFKLDPPPLPPMKAPTPIEAFPTPPPNTLPPPLPLPLLGLVFTAFAAAPVRLGGGNIPNRPLEPAPLPGPASLVRFAARLESSSSSLSSLSDVAERAEKRGLSRPILMGRFLGLTAVVVVGVEEVEAVGLADGSGRLSPLPFLVVEEEEGRGAIGFERVEGGGGEEVSLSESEP